MSSFFSDDEGDEEGAPAAVLPPVPEAQPRPSLGFVGDGKQVLTSFSDDESSEDATSDGRQELAKANAELKDRAERLERELQHWKIKAESLTQSEAGSATLASENALLQQQVRELQPMMREDERSLLQREVLQVVSSARAALHQRGQELLQQSMRLEAEREELRESLRARERSLEEERSAVERLRAELQGKELSAGRAAEECQVQAKEPTASLQRLALPAQQQQGRPLDGGLQGVQQRLQELLMQGERTQETEGQRLVEAHRCVDEALRESRRMEHFEFLRLRALCAGLDGGLCGVGEEHAGPQRGDAPGAAELDIVALEKASRHQAQALEANRLWAEAEVAESRQAVAQLRAELAEQAAEQAARAAEQVAWPCRAERHLGDLEQRCKASAQEVHRLSQHLSEQASLQEEERAGEVRQRKEVLDLRQRCATLEASLASSEAENRRLRSRAAASPLPREASPDGALKTRGSDWSSPGWESPEQSRVRSHVGDVASVSTRFETPSHGVRFFQDVSPSGSTPGRAFHLADCDLSSTAAATKLLHEVRGLREARAVLDSSTLDVPTDARARQFLLAFPNEAGRAA